MSKKLKNLISLAVWYHQNGINILVTVDLWFQVRQLALEEANESIFDKSDKVLFLLKSTLTKETLSWVNLYSKEEF